MAAKHDSLSLPLVLKQILLSIKMKSTVKIEFKKPKRVGNELRKVKV